MVTSAVHYHWKTGAVVFSQRQASAYVKVDHHDPSHGEVHPSVLIDAIGQARGKSIAHVKVYPFAQPVKATAIHPAGNYSTIAQRRLYYPQC